MEIFKKHNKEFLFFATGKANAPVNTNKHTRYIKNIHKLLIEKPWKTCGCEVCEKLGINVVIYRTHQRHISRGFHNMKLFYKEVDDIRSGKCTQGLSKFLKR